MKDTIHSEEDRPIQTEAAYDLFTSGFVNRYHSHSSHLLRNAQDLTDAHSNRMAKLALYLFFKEIKKNPSFLIHIVMHDAGEKKSGDSPPPRQT